MNLIFDTTSTIWNSEEKYFLDGYNNKQEDNISLIGLSRLVQELLVRICYIVAIRFIFNNKGNYLLNAGQ